MNRLLHATGPAVAGCVAYVIGRASPGGPGSTALFTVYCVALGLTICISVGRSAVVRLSMLSACVAGGVLITVRGYVPAVLWAVLTAAMFIQNVVISLADRSADEGPAGRI